MLQRASFSLIGFLSRIARDGTRTDPTGQITRDARAKGAHNHTVVNAKSLWTCASCGRRFANRNQSHACGRHDLAPHFARCEACVRELYERVRCALATIGPVVVLPEKTRIAFQVRMSFAAVTPRRRWLDGHVVLARRLEHPRFRRIDTISARNHVHVFRLERPEDIDEEFVGWLREAYAVGEQRHLARPDAGG